MTSCRNIDLGTSVLDLISCGCGRRQFPKTVCKIGMTRSYGGGGNLLFIRRDVGRSCKAVPTKPPEISLVNGKKFLRCLEAHVLVSVSLIVITNLSLVMLFMRLLRNDDVL